MKNDDKDKGRDEPGPAFRFVTKAAAVLYVFAPAAVGAVPGGHNNMATTTVISAGAAVAPADTDEQPGGGGTRIPGSGGYSGRGTATTFTWLTGLLPPPGDNGGAARTI